MINQHNQSEIKKLIRDFYHLSNNKGLFIDSDNYKKLLETIDTLLVELKSYEEEDSSKLDEKIDEFRLLKEKHKKLSEKSIFYRNLNNDDYKIESKSPEYKQLIREIVFFQDELDDLIKSLKLLLVKNYYNIINTENEDSGNVGLEQERDTGGGTIIPEIEKSSFHELKKIIKRNKDLYDASYIRYDLKRFNKYYKVSINNQDFIFTEIKKKELGENGVFICNDNYYAYINFYNNSLFYLTVYRDPENTSKFIKVSLKLSLSDSKEEALTSIYDKEEYSELVSEVYSHEISDGVWHVVFRRNPLNNRHIIRIDICYASKEDYIMGREPIKIFAKSSEDFNYEKDFKFELLRNGRYRLINNIEKEVSYQRKYTLKYVLGECKKIFNDLYEKEYDLLEVQNLNTEVVKSGINKLMTKEIYYILSELYPEYAEIIRRHAGEEQQNDDGFSVDKKSINGQRRKNFKKRMSENVKKKSRNHPNNAVKINGLSKEKLEYRS